MRRHLFISAAIICLAACGSASEGDRGFATRSASATDCPPEQKGNGIMVSSRYNYEDLLEANRWREDMFPSTCAGTLANLVPALPDGFGVKPTNKPYVMNDNQVYLAYAELPEPLYLEEDIPNQPRDMEAIEYEIVRFSNDEIATLKTWMTANPKNFLTSSVRGHDVHLLGGFGSGRPSKSDRLSTSLHVFLDGNIVVRISHKSLFTQRGGLEISPLVESVLEDILQGAGKT